MLNAYGQDIPRAERRRLQGPLTDSTLVTPEIPPISPQMLEDSLQKVGVNSNVWIPNPTKATWLAIVIPGGACELSETYIAQSDYGSASQTKRYVQKI